jgi:hypothetical protein
VTTDCTSSVDWFNGKAVATITNTTTDAVYVTTNDIYGAYFRSNDFTKEFESTTDSNNTFVLYSPYLEFMKYESTDGVIKDLGISTPITWGSTDSNQHIDDIGATLLNYLSTPRAFPTIQMQGRYSNQFSLDIEDAVQLTLDTLGIDDTYRIHKISHRSGMTCQDVTSTFKLYPIMTKST